MSYEEFRKRIDTLCNILVGAVPSPAGQIDQITYALMYKFMNDIDDQSVSLGGRRTYFTGEFAKFNWHELMSPQIGAHDRLALYRDAIQTMARNENIPELFRSIYQNAFLPFNSASVLNLFLKEINEAFSHGDSDDIGDAYEYLLSKTGAQGDVGQFRTPRHIIKFIVEAVSPTKDDKILDPAVGTAGFLISAYNHVKSQHDGKGESGERNEEKRLSADEMRKIHHNYRGFDIDPTMVRTAKVNMYLHGFKTPDIVNHDSLSSEDYWNEWYDVILANPPFMTPKGGIQPHKKFSIQANRAEVLFVDYIASHLKPNGRAGIVVPEGVIFQSGKAYKELRKNLVENSLYAVVSLPAGVFNPYAGVKTSVLLLDKQLAKQRQDILFVKIENDGYSLSSQRRLVAGDQLPEALGIIEQFKNGQDVKADFAHAVSRQRVAESNDYNLSGDRYKIDPIIATGEHEYIRVGDVIIENQKSTIKVGDAKTSNGSIKFFTSGATQLKYDHSLVSGENVFLPTGGNAYVFYHKGQAAYSTDTWSFKSNDETQLLTRYLYYVLDFRRDYINTAMFKGAGLKHLDKHMLRDFKIPLPSVEVQRALIEELDSFQNIIDSARKIVHTYKPVIKIGPGWRVVELGDVIQTLTDFTANGSFASLKENVQYKSSPDYAQLVRLKDLRTGLTNHDKVYVSKQSYDFLKKTSLTEGDFLIANVGANVGDVYLMPKTAMPSTLGPNMYLVRFDEQEILTKFAYYLNKIGVIKEAVVSKSASAAQPKINKTDFRSIKIPLPTIEIQHKIVTELEEERRLVNANKKLIEIHQQKIKSKIAEVWGE